MFTRSFLLLLLLSLVLCGLSVMSQHVPPVRPPPSPPQSNPCPTSDFEVVESIPLGMKPSFTKSIYQGWLDLINKSKETLDIAAMYMTLSQGNDYPKEAGGHMGTEVLEAIIAAANRGVKVRLVTTWPVATEAWKTDPALLAKSGVEVLHLDWPKLTPTGEDGVLHTKFIVADGHSLYLGSANFDWRALSQIKELGVIISECPPLAGDLDKIFQLYVALSKADKLPTSYPVALDTAYNVTDEANFLVGGELFTGYFGASPSGFITPHRTNDWLALVYTIHEAEQKVSLSVMDYSPVTLYQPDKDYWGNIDNALRDAAFRGVQVQLLFSCWPHTDPVTIQYMRSLAVLDNVEVKLMTIPPGNVTIPFTRVNHAKYLVNDARAYVTTSNYTPDYFLYSGGVSITFDNDKYEAVIQHIFDQDWNSEYSKTLTADVKCDCHLLGTCVE